MFGCTRSLSEIPLNASGGTYILVFVASNVLSFTMFVLLMIGAGDVFGKTANMANAYRSGVGRKDVLHLALDDRLLTLFFSPTVSAQHSVHVACIYSLISNFCW